MPLLRMDFASSFDELYKYWKQAENSETPFTALLLSTTLSNLDKRVTYFVQYNRLEINNMSGKDCAIFAMLPPQHLLQPFSLQPLSIQRHLREIQDVSYDVARLLNISPETFPSLVFFDNLVRPKQTVVISLKNILGSEPSDDELATFFRTLFTITHDVADAPKDDRLERLQITVAQKWQLSTNPPKADFVKIVETTLSVSEIVKNVVEIAMKFSNRLT